MKKNIFLGTIILFLAFGIFGNIEMAKAGCCVKVPSSVEIAKNLATDSVPAVRCQESGSGSSCSDGMKLFKEVDNCADIGTISSTIGISGCSSIDPAPTATSAPITKVTSVAPAKYEYQLMEGIPGFVEAGEVVDFPVYIKYLYNFGIWTIGICAMLMITLGGYMYLTSAGNTASTGKAKGIITDAIIGLILALTSYLILYTINPDLVKFNSLTNQSTINSNAQCPLP